MQFKLNAVLNVCLLINRDAIPRRVELTMSSDGSEIVCQPWCVLCLTLISGAISSAPAESEWSYPRSTEGGCWLPKPSVCSFAPGSQDERVDTKEKRMRAARSSWVPSWAAPVFVGTVSKRCLNASIIVITHRFTDVSARLLGSPGQR